jgi:uncharacterized membrane protein
MITHFWKSVLKYFLQGLLLVSPLAITLYVLYQLFTALDNVLKFDLFPGAGILMLFVAITLLGLLGNTIIVTPIKMFFTQMLDRAPLIKTIYSAITDLLSAFIGQKRKFNQPVLVKLSKESNIEKLGFITEEDLSILGLTDGKIAVYLPHSYNFSGNLFIVERHNVVPLNVSASEVMKFIVSGGITHLNENAESKTE